jgi:acetate kinase
VIVLALNAGSSTLKASLLDDERVIARRTLEWTEADRVPALEATLAGLALDGTPPDVVAHRVVHGGPRLRAHVRIDAEALRAIEAATDLAPLHNGAALETIRLARERLPAIPHVACFDTAFHATLPAIATREPVPTAWADLGIRRYGFHGLSVEWSLARAAELLGRPVGDLYVVVAHLGNGASVTAVDGGRSAWSSMGYTPLDGIVMGTRSGTLDPAIVVDLVTRHGRAIEDVADELLHGSGLRGVSETSGDVRALEAAADAGEERARLALDLFVARAAAGIAGAATWLPRLDAVVFTGGIGEHAGRIRSAIVDRLAVLGLPPVAPAEAGEDRVLAAGPPAVLRIEAREDAVMARAAAHLLGDRPTG